MNEVAQAGTVAARAAQLLELMGEHDDPQRLGSELMGESAVPKG